MGSDVDEQARKIRKFCLSQPVLRGWQTYRRGTSAAPVKGTEGLRRLASYPPGTLFAVCVTGYIEGARTSRCHPR